MIKFECKKCHSNEFFIKENGNQNGLYCADCGAWQKWLGRDEYSAYTNMVKPITNLEKLSQINNMANLIYDTSVYDTAYCQDTCPCEKRAEMHQEIYEYKICSIT
ncbi:MAG: hypothetical protein E7255_15505 [Lachnospiraceae bacterium]|nr:hypothetical protein [Lachnospiraceae bacterium]